MFSLTAQQKRGKVVVNHRFDNSPEQNSPFGVFLKAQADTLVDQCALFELQDELIGEACADYSDDPIMAKACKPIGKELLKARESGKVLGKGKLSEASKKISAARKASAEAEAEAEEEKSEEDDKSAEEQKAKELKEAEKLKEADDLAKETAEKKEQEDFEREQEEIERKRLDENGAVSTTPPDSNPETTSSTTGDPEAVKITGGENDPATGQPGPDSGQEGDEEPPAPAPQKKIAKKKVAVVKPK